MTRAALVLLWCLVWLPPLGPALRATMTTHMILQMPLLVLAGWCFATHATRRRPSLRSDLRPYRWALLVLGAGTLGLWMIPRLVDAASEGFLADMAKVFTLTFTGGAPLRLAWSNLGPVTRALVHVEALASAWRLGWLYLESPTRLCSQYSLPDQDRLGCLLIAAGALYAAWLAWCAVRVPPP